MKHFMPIIAALIAAVVITGAAPLSPSLAEDIERGRELYGECESCHGLEPGRHRVGPSLHGVFGREAGTAPGFRRYSQTMRDSGVVWNAETLSAYIADPTGFLSGTRKAFSGLGSAEDRADLIAYLREATQ